jgi:hypothetical protein
MIQINDFSVHTSFNDESDRWIETDFYDFSRGNFTPTAIVRAFAGILSEIGFSASCERSGHAG